MKYVVIAFVMVAAALALGIWIGIKSFENAVKEAIEDLMGIEDLTGRKAS